MDDLVMERRDATNFVPLCCHSFLFLPEDDANFVLVLDVCYDKNPVTFLQGEVQIREEHFVVSLHAGNDQMVHIFFANDVVNGFAEKCRILHLAGKTIGVTLIVFAFGSTHLFLVHIHPENGFGEQKDSNGPQYAQRIGHCVGRCYSGCGILDAGRHRIRF